MFENQRTEQSNEKETKQIFHFIFEYYFYA